MNIENKILDLLKEEFPSAENCKGFKPNDYYTFNGYNVPRVTKILDETINEGYLIRWANTLGFKQLDYGKVLNEAADIGSKTHSYIENYLQGRDTPYLFNDAVVNCTNSFKEWWSGLISLYDVEILGEEQKLTCPWYGGTYDLLLNVAGSKVLVDFKTSNKINFKYFLQLAAYRYLINLNLGFDINDFIILRLSKNTVHYEDMCLDMTLAKDSEFMQYCSDTFFSLLNSYYQVNRVKYYFNQLHHDLITINDVITFKQEM